MLSAPKKVPLKHRISMIFIQFGQIDVLDGAFVVIDENGVRTQIPVGMVACIMLEPGTRISHAAVHLAATVGTLLIWVGQGGVRLYSSGQPGGARSDKLLLQAKLNLDNDLRLKVARKMFSKRFGEEAPQKRNIDQLKGIEGARVKEMYRRFSGQYGIKWNGRNYDQDNWDFTDPINKAISAATSCLYGISEAAVLAAGYAPAIGFVHSGSPLSFVYDVADIIKFETVIPIAFQVTRNNPENIERATRLACRDLFKKERILGQLIPLIEEILAAGEIPLPEPAPDMVLPQIPLPINTGDEGQRGK